MRSPPGDRAARRQSADQVIVAGLAALHREGRRRASAAEVWALKDDAADLAGLRAIQKEMLTCMRAEVHRLPA